MDESNRSADGKSTSSKRNKKAKSSSAAAGGSSQQQQQQPQRTIQVKIGGQAAKSMTPDQAAEYLKSIAGKAGVAGRAGGLGGELKMTFSTASSSSSAAAAGAPPTTAALSTQAGAGGGGGSGGGGSASVLGGGGGAGGGSSGKGPRRKDGMPCSEKEMKALMSMFVEIMGLQMNTEKLNQCKSSVVESARNRNKKRKGRNQQQQQGSGKDADGSGRGKRLFTFPQDLPPPPGGWPEDLLWPTNRRGNHGGGTGSGDGNGGDCDDDDDDDEDGYYSGDDDDDDEISSLPDLEDVVKENVVPSAASGAAGNGGSAAPASSAGGDNKGAPVPYPIATAAAAMATAAIPQVQPEPVTGTRGIAILEWEALERVAIEDALEQEERARKSAAHGGGGAGGGSGDGGGTKNGGGTTASSATTTTTTAQKLNPKKKKQAEAKRKKALASWKTRVLTAVQSGQVDRLEPLLEENKAGTLWSGMTDEALAPQIEGLVVACLPKNRFASYQQNNPETRERLTEFLLGNNPQLFAKPTRHNGRSALHTAAFYGNVDLMQQICKANQAKAKELDWITCLDSGWTLLQYASVSGSIQAVEYVLKNCCEVTSGDETAINNATNDTFTWAVGPGHGLTVLEIIDCIINPQERRKHVETSGMALSEIDKDYMDGSAKEVEYRCKLRAVQMRLEQILSKGTYVPLTKDQIAKLEDSTQQQARDRIAAAQKEKHKHDQQQQQQLLAASQPKAEEAEDEDEGEGEVAVITPASSVAASEEKSKKGKKNKKRKKKQQRQEQQQGNDANSATAASIAGSTTERSSSPEAVEDGSSSAAGSSSKKQDPMVTALIAMGFEQPQIAAGIEACGGVHRATPDDVVTWIVGRGEGLPAPTASTVATKQPAAKKATTAAAAVVGASTDAKTKEAAAGGPLKQESCAAVAAQPAVAAATAGTADNKKADRSVASSQSSRKSSAAEAKRQEAAKRAEEERIAAAKRKEEQRRRNREWNNKELEKQQKEAQAKITQDMKKVAAAAAGTGGPDPYRRSGSGNNWPPQNKVSLPQHQRRGAPSPKPPLGDVAVGNTPTNTSSKRRDLPENVVLNTDASIASSMDNDDITVSTLGSLTARGATPVMALGLNHPSQQQQPPQQPSYPHHQNPYNPHALQQQPPNITQQVVPPGFGQAVRPLVAGDNSFRGSSGRAVSTSSLPPHGIPESQPFIVDHPRSTSMTMSRNAYQTSSTAASNSFGNATMGNGNVAEALAGSQSRGPSGYLGGPAMHHHQQQSMPSIPPSGYAGGHLGGYGGARPAIPGPIGYGARVASHDSSISPVPPSVASSVSGSGHHPHLQQQRLGLGSFGLEPHAVSTQQRLQQQKQQQQQQAQLDASIIDSISTGNTDLGSALWGGPGNTSRSTTGSSSLLGNLINTNSAIGETARSSQQSSLFPTNSNPNNQQQGNGADSVSEGLWGEGGSFHRSGSGSIW